MSAAALAALAWVRANIVPTIIMVALFGALGWFGWTQWQRLHTAKTEVQLSTGQTGAAIQSGTDAVQTLGNEQAREGDIHQTVKDGTDAIDQAPAGDSNDAADRATCRMRSYRNLPRCVALLGPSAK